MKHQVVVVLSLLLSTTCFAQWEPLNEDDLSNVYAQYAIGEEKVEPSTMDSTMLTTLDSIQFRHIALQTDGEIRVRLLERGVELTLPDYKEIRGQWLGNDIQLIDVKSAGTTVEIRY